MKAYKIKHLPTGLYYTPSRGYGNLSTRGKIYVLANPPKISWVGDKIRIVLQTWNDKLSVKDSILVDFFKLTPNSGGLFWIDQYFQTSEQDWQIEELKLN